jgi:hypothetical protein
MPGFIGDPEQAGLSLLTRIQGKGITALNLIRK